jgi:hypothetical protein
MNNTLTLSKKIVAIYSFYLTLGGIALFLSIPGIVSYLSFASYGYGYSAMSSTFLYVLLFYIFLLIAGILLVIAFYGLLNKKSYSLITGIIGCIFFMMWSFYLIVLPGSFSVYSIIYFLYNFLPPLALLLLTMKYLKELR